jgi:hypothetical protein
MNAEQIKPVDERTGYRLLWLGVLLAPIVWLIQFQLRYSLVEPLCHRGIRFPLYIISAVFFILIIMGGLLSWRNWVLAGKRLPSDKQSDPRERNLFLALLGILTSALFALLLIAQTIASIMIDPCWH